MTAAATPIVHGSICCSAHGCAVSCTGSPDANVLVGTCPQDGALIAMGSPKYFRDHAAGVALPLDMDAEIEKHQNRHIAHMFEEDGSLKAEYADAPAEDDGLGPITHLDSDGQSVRPTLHEWVQAGYKASDYDASFPNGPGKPLEA